MAGNEIEEQEPSGDGHGPNEASDEAADEKALRLRHCGLRHRVAPLGIVEGGLDRVPHDS